MCLTHTNRRTSFRRGDGARGRPDRREASPAGGPSLHKCFSAHTDGSVPTNVVYGVSFTMPPPKEREPHSVAMSCARLRLHPRGEGLPRDGRGMAIARAACLRERLSKRNELVRFSRAKGLLGWVLAPHDRCNSSMCGAAPGTPARNAASRRREGSVRQLLVSNGSADVGTANAG